MLSWQDNKRHSHHACGGRGKQRGAHVPHGYGAHRSGGRPRGNSRRLGRGSTWARGGDGDGDSERRRAAYLERRGFDAEVQLRRRQARDQRAARAVLWRVGGRAFAAYAAVLAGDDE